MRTDLYSLIHKAQREHLFRLASQLCKLNTNDETKVAEFEQKFLKMLKHLHKHSQSEHEFIHPLFKKVGNEAEILDNEHVKLEQSLEKLEQLMAAKHYAALYQQLNLFIADYLNHTAEEEQAQADILWQHYTDAQLAEVMSNFQKSLSQQETMDNMAFMLPCLSASDVTSMLQKIRANAPAAAFQAISQLAEKHVAADIWQTVQNNLAAN